MTRGLTQETRRSNFGRVGAGLSKGDFDRHSEFKFSEISCPYPQIKPFRQGNLDAFAAFTP